MIPKLYFVEIDEKIDLSVFKSLVSLVSAEKQQKISQMRSYVDKKLCLFSELLTRYLISQNLHISNQKIHFYTNDFGKPYLMGYPHFQFNFSHTKNAIALGISKKPLGVDIEKVKSFDINIAKRFFSENELNYILMEDNHQDQRFYEIWTQKEAYIKYIGKGLAIQLKTFDVTQAILKEKICTFKMNNYMISTFSEAQFKEDEIVNVSEQDLIAMARTLLYNGIP